MSLVLSPFIMGAQKMVTYTDAALVGGATVKLLDANSNRTTVYIYNVGTVAARLGDADTGAARGAPLAASQGITIETTAAVYAYSASATTLTILEAVRP